MENLYPKMCATLVGRVDHAVTYAEHTLRIDLCDREHVEKICNMLKAALLEAEEMFLAAEDN